MINENILYEMEQRPGERTGKFLSRQQAAKNTIRRMNALEVHLSHLMAETEPGRMKMGDTLNENRTKATTKAKESVPSIA